MRPANILLLLLAALLAACAGDQMAEPAAPREIAPTPSPSAVALPTKLPVPTQTTAAAAVPVEEAREEPATPAATPTLEPQVTLEVTEQPPVVEIISGQTEEGAYFYGNPDAVVTLIDYSDFL